MYVDKDLGVQMHDLLGFMFFIISMRNISINEDHGVNFTTKYTGRMG